MRAYTTGILTTGVLLLGACGGGHEDPAPQPAVVVVQGEDMVIAAAARTAFMNVSGSAAPLQEATLSTKLMGSVTRVNVQEGDVVRRGQPLLHIDARDLAAQAVRIEAGMAEAEAVYREAELHAQRMRALYEDDAAPKAQLDAAETGLARARAGVSAARAGGAELSAMAEYSVVRAPFDGLVVRRLVDPGSFAAPGSPLLVLQDDSALRVSVTATPDVIHNVARGDEIAGTIEGQDVTARIEGVVPAAGGNLYTVNAVVPNPGRRLPARGTAALALPLGTRDTFVIPVRALVRQGDMTGVYLRRGSGTLLRWVKTGPVAGDSVEVTAGLRDADVIVVPTGQPVESAAVSDERR